MGRTPLEDGPWADSPAGAGAGSTEGVRWRAPLSYFRPPPPVPGLFWFRARVILLPDSTDASDSAAPGTWNGPNSPAP